jgi:hypothetical protein
MVDNWDEKANDFLNKTKTTLMWTFLGLDHEGRKVYKWTLKRGSRKAIGEFVDSLHKSKESYQNPSSYDLLSCLEKNEPEDLDSFSANYGYGKISETIKVWHACNEQYHQLCELFNEEEMDELGGIY